MFTKSALFISFWLVASGNVLAKTWTDKSGKFQVQAELVGVKDGKAILKRDDDGRVISVPLKSLSDADRRFALENAGQESDTDNRRGEPPTTTVDADEALKKPVRADFQQVPLSKAMGQLARQAGTSAMVDGAGLNQLGLAADAPVTLAAEGTLSEVLDQLLDRFKLQFLTRESVILITGPKRAANLMRPRVFRVRTQGRGGRGDINDLLNEIQKVSPNSWEALGGPGVVAPLGPSTLVVLQTDSILQSLQNQYAGVLIPIPVPQRTNHSLATRIHISSDENTLRQIAEAIREQARMDVTIDEESLTQIGLSGETPIASAELRNVSVETALFLLLRPAGLGWARDQAGVVVSSLETLEGRLQNRPYSIRDVVPASFGRLLSNVIMTTIQPRSWQPLGGKGSIDVRPAGLSINASDSVHREIERFFATLRGGWANQRNR